MPWSPSSLGTRIRSWFPDYDRVQFFVVILIYIHIGCAMLGALGVMFNDVLVISMVVALFALVVIERSSQSLDQAYANNREPADFRWRPGPHGRGGRGNYPSRYVSRDVTGGRNANFGKENEINQVIDKSTTPASAYVMQDT